MPLDHVSLEVKGALALLRIENGPLNILSLDLRKQLLDRVLEIERRTETRVVVMEGAGEKAFSVGSDIHEFPTDMLGGLEKIRFEQFLIERIEQLPQLTVVKLRGHVLGGGGELMLAFDFRLATTTATFGFPEIKLGALPAAGGIKRLVRDIGPVRARDLICRGRTIDAVAAEEVGLITACFPPDELDAAANTLAEELCALPGDAVRLAKGCIRAASRSLDIDTIEASAFAALYQGSNLSEGLRAFMQKRPPAFNR